MISKGREGNEKKGRKEERTRKVNNWMGREDRSESDGSGKEERKKEIK